MMTMQMDMTGLLVAIRYGLALTLGVSAVGIVMSVSRDEVRRAKRSLAVTYRHYREFLRRRHIHLVSSLHETSRAH